MSRARRIPENSAEYARWLASQIEGRDGGLWLSSETAMFVGMALRGYGELLDHHAAGRMTFVITAIDDFGRSEAVAATLGVEAAWAAFQAAIPSRPNCRLVLHQGARILGEHPPPAMPKAAT